MRPFGLLTVRRKLQLVGALALVAVLALAGSSLYFAGQTKKAAYLLMERGITGTEVAGRLDMLLQQHKGLVLSAPAELDRGRIAATRAAVAEVSARLSDEMARAPSALGDLNRSWLALSRQIEPQLPDLFANADQVIQLAHDFVQDQSLEVAQGPYAEVSERMLRQIAAWQGEQRQALNKQVAGLLSASDRMVSWVGSVTTAALVVGSIGIAVMAGVLRRLQHVQRAMHLLAARDNAVTVPFLAAADEIGAMARAVQVFKLNALQIAEQETELRQANLRFETALSNMSQGLCLYDSSGRLEVFNEQFCTMFRLDRGRMRPRLTFREVLQISLDAGNHPGVGLDQLHAERQAVIDRGEPDLSLEELGGGRVIAIFHCPMPQGGWVATYEDITSRRAAEEKLVYLARHDVLTGLPNRLVLQERLDSALADAGRGSSAAILCLDLDHFKAVNDTLGHPVGDGLLRAVSERLQACVREGDTVTRLGGDEFAIVQAGISRPEEAKLLAERINGVIAAPFLIEGHQIVVGASVGIALLPGDGKTCTALLRNADMALYRAKSDGRGTFCFFEPTMDALLQNRRSLEMDLRAAIKAEQFELYYQPLVDLAHDHVSGFEALLRWRHPVRGMVSPVEFIPIAEELGLIATLGEWVICKACAEATGWPGKVSVAVNLSPVQFKSETLVSTVRHALASSGLAASRLQLEITESVLLQNSAATLETLHELRALGARISMDDFGTGYSSLSYLRSFPFDKIKIDQSFIRDLSTRGDAIHIVRAVQGICSGLGMVMTAEGVETEEQLSILRNEGCMEIQGYLFSRPKPATDVAAIIRSVRERTLDGHPALRLVETARMASHEVRAATG